MNFGGLVLLGLILAQNPNTENQEISELMELSVSELQEVIVTSVSKREEKLFSSTAAVHVLTQEDLRRSGATTIMEALRMVPGMDVANIDSNKWAITARGFNDLFARKLLVLMDGRTVYTPVFSGVYWDAQDTVMEDIERIEVIRGPGGTLWGANAMNGVINIITKNSKSTQGGLASAGGGTVEQGFGTFRYGGKVADNASFRVYSKYFNRDDFDTVAGAEGNSEWEAIRGGFRTDWELSTNRSLTLQGDFYKGDSRQEITGVASLTTPPFMTTVPSDNNIEGGNILARWKHQLSPDSNYQFQMYYDRADRDEITFGQSVNTIDFDFQHQVQFHGHQLIWGLGHRIVSDSFDNGTIIQFQDSKRTFQTPSAFIQDEFYLVQDRLRATIGSKFQINPFSGFEYQPTARLLWTPHEQHTVWGGVSRAVRTPSRVEDDFTLNTAITPISPARNALIVSNGNLNFESEEQVAYELGYRFKTQESFSLDVTTFLNTYNNLATIEPSTPGFRPPFLLLSNSFANQMSGEGYGVEVAGTWKPFDIWKLNAAFSWYQLDLNLDSTSRGSTNQLQEGQSPEFKFNIRSYLDLPHNLELDTALYYVDQLPGINIPSYTRFDIRLGWNPIKELELSVALQNLADDNHQEFTTRTGITPTLVPRSAYGKVTWRFN